MVLNQFKTVVLLGLMTALLLWVGQLLGGISGLYIAGAFAIIMNFGSYWFSDKIVLKMYRAKEVKDTEHRLHKIVKEVVELAKVPMPKVYIMPSDNPNAFATGRNPKHAAVATTQGILNLLNDEELKGVMAHEMAHVKNRDILISTIAGTIAGVISYVAFMARWAAIFGGRDRDSGNMASMLVLAIITPLIAMIIQLAISRSREYLADATGANMLKNPDGLASALAKLEQGVKTHPMKLGNNATAHMFIANPFRAGGIMKLLSTHPPMQTRINKLKSLKF
jgi:heat shock protein HtpX|tara:strand:- start:6038 stop:6877 length:840 start_codon:yes stop_codon:yes gene_type:complete